jgi:hypothetical protein
MREGKSIRAGGTAREGGSWGNGRGAGGVARAFLRYRGLWFFVVTSYSRQSREWRRDYDAI